MRTTCTFHASHAQPSCFICLEPCQHVVVCQCRRMPCHAVCQQRLIDRQGTVVCRVCNAPYTNVEQVTVTVPFHVADCVTCFAIMFLIAGSGMLLWTFCLYATHYYLLAESCFMFLAGCLCFFFWRRSRERPVARWRVVASAGVVDVETSVVDVETSIVDVETGSVPR